MIDLVYKILEFWINKKQEGGLPSPEEYNNASKIAQINVINNHVKREGYERYGFDGDEITEIKRSQVLSKTNGFFTKPTDFMFLMSLSYFNSTVSQNRDVKILRESAFQERANSKLLPPSNNFPIAKKRDVGYEVLPITINSITCVYIKKPSDPIWAFTSDANGRPVYDSGNSTDFELPLSMVNELALEVFKQMNLNVSKTELVALSQQLISNE